MFRVSQYLRELCGEPPAAARRARGPVVIWNLLRRCNLACKHCYAISADHAFAGELTTAEVLAVMEELRAFGVPALVLSGGEPLLHPDIFAISRRAKELGFYLALSSNGTPIDERCAERIAEVGYDYVGISLDGLAATHDRFRRREGAFALSLAGLRRCRERGVNVGLRFTLTADNAAELPALLELGEREAVDKFYLSHLNYAGRGNRNRGCDAHHAMTREAMDLIFATALADARAGRRREIVTGNNDADAVYLLRWAERRFPGEAVARLRARLLEWGGNASGVAVANIDNLGVVHPDTMWWHHPLGSVRERPFAAIWEDRSDPLMDGLKSRPRPLEGRCARCAERAICGGNTRVRAEQLTGNPWAEDPGCYLENAEIGLAGSLPPAAGAVA